MAIDTRNKRFALMHLDLPWRVLPDPDGAFDAGDRMQLAMKYRGLVAGGGGDAAHYYKQVHHRMGRQHVTAEADVPQKYQKIG